METDAEGPEDVSDLEARLYGLVHHEPATAEPEGVQPSSANNKMVSDSEGADKTSNCRYWNKGQQPFRPKKRINPFAGIPQSREENSPEEVVQTPKEIKPFRPYVPYMLKNEVIPDASGDDPEPKGSSTKLISGANSGQDNISTTKLVGKCGKNVPFGRKMAKISQAIKYQLKKMKANQAREKQKDQKRPQVQIETIIVTSSDEDDDVLEVPVPAPPTVTIDSSGESDNENNDSGTFLRPQELSKCDDKTNSRCVSPSSVMSDDFIGQTDRSRIAHQKNVADDEDLIFLHETVDRCVYQNKDKDNIPASEKEGDNSIEKPDFVTPKKKKTSKQPDYNVTQSNFRAIDVYESESSDMPEYDKDKEKALKAKSDLENDKERTKKLRKRRKSGSAKESEPNESSDSEEEHVAKTSVPFIMRGEAVESCKDSRKRSRPSVDTDPSDKDFINMLATISQPKKLPIGSSESEKSTESIEDITARELVEDVLNKKKKSNHTRNDNKMEVEQSDAVPILDTSADIDKILDSIDKMQSVIESSEPESEKCEIEEYTGEEEVLSISDVVKYQRPHEIAPDDNGLYTVYTHGKYISWSEEMIRFYDLSWGGEKFNVKQVRRMMNASDKWTIYTEDRFPKARRFINLKCHNCCEYGHIRSRCPRPRKDLVCYMCGEIGHLEPRCPNTICLRCGNKTNVFTKSCNICTHENRLICPICKIRGHSTQLCPDKWRRYHSTTQANEYPNKKCEYNERKYCCICAEEGHLSEQCKSSVRFLEYPPSVSEIKAYAKAYDDDLIKHPLGKNVTGYSLISRPCEGVLFNYSHDITIKQYYGRFLNAVGLDHLMTWGKKQKSSKRKSETLTADEPKKKAKKKNYVLNPFAKRNKEVENPIEQDHENIEEEHPASDIVLNIADSNKKQEEEIFKTPTVSPSVRSLKASSETSPAKPLDAQSQKNDETTNSYTAFSKNMNNNQSTPNPKQGKCRELGPLPDFIPLNDSDGDDDEDMDNETAISKNISTKSDEAVVDENIACEAKIYLTKFHSKFLMSPEGNIFLADNSKKFDVKTRIEWTSVGNILLIDGLPPNQDKFHEELLETFRNLSDKTNRRELEKSQKLPKRRDTLIKFLQESILQLDKTLGSVIDLYNRLQIVQNQQTKTSWKTAEKTRKTLNMILMGQIGLRKGKENLEALINNLKALQQNDSMEVVPDKVRDEIGECWRYIFSSQQHDNYDDLIQQYIELKKNNDLPKLNLNYRLLGKKVLDVSLTDEQKQRLNLETQKEEPKIEEKSAPTPPKFRKEVKIPQPTIAPKRMPQPFNRQNQQYQHQFRRQNNNYGRNFKPRTFVSDQIRQVNRGWKNHYHNLVNQLDERPDTRKNIPNKPASSSVFWSRECIKFIDECLAMNPSFSTVSAKLHRVQEKARQGLLCPNDYKALQRIHSVLKGRAN